MCNYLYQYPKHHLTGASCIYPSFYIANGLELPVDSYGYCVFHSTNRDWKIENNFIGKFEELFTLHKSMAIAKQVFEHHFNFSGFCFVSEKSPFIISNCDIPHSIDFSYCEFMNGFLLEYSNIKSLELGESYFHELVSLFKVNIWDNLFCTKTKFDNGLLLTHCSLQGDSYFDQCSFKNVKKSSANDVKFRDSFTDYVNFEKSTFESGVLFEKITFKGEAIFDRCTFSDEFHFHSSVVNSLLSFTGTQFLLSENTNPMLSTVDFENLTLTKYGKISFTGSVPFEGMVNGQLHIGFKKVIEGLITFENFNLNKISSYVKSKILELEKTGKVQIGKGCRKYYCQTDIFEIKATKPNQKLILDLVKVFSNYFEIKNHYNLGVEIVEKNSELIRYFFFTDELISKNEFENRITQNEHDLWETFENLSKYGGEQLNVALIEERNTLIDMAAIFLKIRIRIVAIEDYEEEELKKLTDSISLHGNSRIDNHHFYVAIQNGFKEFYKTLPSIRIKLIENDAGLKDFLNDFIEGIQRLQSNDSNENCIENIKKNILNESPFRYWFINWFSSKGYMSEAESQKGSGRIDCKVSHKSIGKKIIEFKGWWNKDKGGIVKQVCSYLTEFEGDGYIFIINHRIKDITESYKKLILMDVTGYQENSWKTIKFPPTEFVYYKSTHRLGTKEKFLYHFIYSVY